jgi:hypothetical protein
MKKYQVITIVLMLSIIMIPFSLNLSCQYVNSTSIPDCSYKICSTLDKEFSRYKIIGQPDFIFEYPGCYKFFSPGNPTDKNVTKLAFAKDIDDYTKSSLIQVSVMTLEKTNQDSNAYIAIKEFLINAKNNERYDNYSLVEMSSIIVNSINAESATILVHSKADKYYPPMSDIFKQVNFEYKSNLWGILLNCNYQDVSQHMPYFEHVLNTFKIIENTSIVNPLK